MSKIQLSDRFGYKILLQFTLPSIVMMIFTSIYGVIDGVFVSNFVGKTPFAAVNFVMPLLMILGSAGFMFGTGGSAVVAKTMGEGDPVRANRLFSMLVYVTIGTGIVVGGIFFVLLEPVLHLMGAQETMLADCMKYGRILLVSLPFLMLLYLFQSFFITAEQPKLGLAVTVIAGCTVYGGISLGIGRCSPCNGNQPGAGGCAVADLFFL